MYIYICICCVIKTDVHTYIHIYIYTYIHIYLFSYIRTYIYTYAHTKSEPNSVRNYPWFRCSMGTKSKDKKEDKKEKKEKAPEKRSTSDSSGGSSPSAAKTEPARLEKERSSDVEEVTPPDPRCGRKETREPVERNLLKEARKRRLSRERRERHEARREHRDRSRSESSRRRGRSPDSRKETPPAERDDRKPAHPKHAPKKDRGGSGGSKERCPICWQKVSIHQSGKDQHMWTNATCIAWQIYNNQQTSKKNWSLAQKQAKELKAYRAKKAEKDLGGPLLVSKETKEAAEKAQASTAAWARGKKPCRVDSSSPSPERVKKTKAKRRPPSPSPSPLPAKKSKQRRSSSDSSSRPRRRRERQIIINVK